MNSLPLFSLGAYRNLLERLKECDYPLLPVSSVAETSVGRAVFLRHDVDFSLEWVLPMAELEADMGIKATYYVLLNGPYTIEGQGQQHLKHLSALGHELGLHYDMREYPESKEAQRSQLEAEIRKLSELSGCPVNTITMHEPHRGHGDPFREDRWIHPHDETWFNNLTYISDSCRGWRDSELLHFLEPEGPDRLLLLTHPELWMDGNIADRMEYLTQVLIPRTPTEALPYFQDEVPSIWKKHVGALSHDLRNNLEEKQCRIQFIDREWTLENMGQVLTLFEQSTYLPWKEREILMEVPGKWEDSVALIQGEKVLAISFNSIRDDRTYIHAIISHPLQRGEGYGSLLMQFIQLAARKKARTGIQLCVSHDNPAAKHWYLQHGFKVVRNDPAQNQEVLQWEQS